MSDNAEPTPDVPERFVHHLRQNGPLWESLQRLASLDLPHWYLGAGCIAQTVWNIAHSKPVAADIADYDIVYFDPDLSSDWLRERFICMHRSELMIFFPWLYDQIVFRSRQKYMKRKLSAGEHSGHNSRL